MYKIETDDVYLYPFDRDLRNLPMKDNIQDNALQDMIKLMK